MGGNAAFHPILVDGGTLYIDDGRPMPGQIEETLRNLREMSPTYYANVPAGYAALAAAMEKDDALCRSFFKNLSIMAYGGARLPDDLYDRMQALAVRTTGERIVFYTGWGSTETAPTSTGTYWDTERVGLIGLPFPGVELKMVPCGSKYELRLRGINVTPGYFGQPDLTKKMFDEEGFYCIGDAGMFVDHKRSPAGHHLRRPRGRGFQAHHRHLRPCRLAAHRCDRGGNARRAGRAGGRAGSPVHRASGLAQSARLPADRRQSRCDLRGCRQASRGDRLPEARAGGAQRVRRPRSSMRIARAMLMVEPPSIDGNELTDKGYINQRAGLERRAALVERLYAEQPGEDVIVLQ